jgi:hypothetical protein
MTEQDNKDILALVLAYPRGIDSGDFDSIGRLFAHGSWNSRRGAEEAVAYLHRNMIVYADGTPRTAHQISNLLIDVHDSQSAEATSRITVMQQVDEPGPVIPIAALDYHDWFARHDGQWVFRHRDVQLRFGDLSRHLRAAPPAATGRPIDIPDARPSDSPSAEHAITRLNFEYARRIDEGDVDGFANLFELGRWNELNGSDAVADWLRRWVILYDGMPRTQHAVQNLWIDVDGDRATGSCTIAVYQMAPGAEGISIITVNDYDDTYRLEGGEWVWTERRIRRRLIGDTSKHRSGPADW